MTEITRFIFFHARKVKFNHSVSRWWKIGLRFAEISKFFASRKFLAPESEIKPANKFEREIKILVET